LGWTFISWAALATLRSALEKARIVATAAARSSSGSARRLLPLDAMMALVVAVAPISAHSSEERSSRETIGRLGDVYDSDSAGNTPIGFADPVADGCGAAGWDCC
jgi:hypothetical protein